MKHDTDHLVKGAPVENRDEFREQEGDGVGDRAAGIDIERRSEIARHLDPSVFPARRDDLVASAEKNNAPDDVLADVRHLPDGRTYENVEAVWEALGGTPEGHRTARG